MNYEFKSDVFVSGTSATISATTVMPVVPSTTTYIISEQTVTASDFELYNQHDNFYVYRAPLTSSFPISDLYDGCKATLYYDMNEYKMEYHAANSVFTCDENRYIAVQVTESGYYLVIVMASEMPEWSSATVYLSTSVPEVEPKWKNPEIKVIKVLRSLGPNVGSNESGHCYAINMTESEVLSCFNETTYAPLYVFIPSFVSFPGYSYSDPSNNFMHLLANAGESIDLGGIFTAKLFINQLFGFCLLVTSSSSSLPPISN